MKIFVQGLWHCGCVISASLASLKHNVIAYDDNKKIINKLKKNITPIFEPKLKDLIKTSTKDGKLSFVVKDISELKTAISFCKKISLNESLQQDLSVMQKGQE